MASTMPLSRRRISSKSPARKAAKGSTTAPPPPLPQFLTFSAVSSDPALTFLADNDHILSGYRHRGGYLPALTSVFYLHNETANIWTHLAGALTVLFLLGCTAFSPATLGLLPPPGCPASSAPPVWPMQVFLSGAASCLGISVAYHALFTVSPALDAFLNKLDYTGISLLIFTSNVPPVYYAFHSHPALGAAYTALAFGLNLLAAVLGTVDFFRTAQWRHLRALAYVLCGATGVIPLLHFLHLSAAAHPADWPTAWALLCRTGLMGAQYIVGAFLFGLRIPERFAPGSFDYFSSHSVFHVLVVTAVLTHWETVRAMWLWRSSMCS